jgi:hypothetical protein
MSLFKRKKPKFTELTTIKDLKSKIREFVLDSQISNAHEICDNLGCIPISDEVAEKEEEESDKRVDRINFLVPLLYGYATLFSEAFIDEASVTHDGIPEELSKVIASITDVTKHVLEDAMAHFLVGAVSQLVDLEFLQVNGKAKK